MDSSPVKHDYSFGVIPFANTEGERLYLLIHQAKGHWAFPKGHKEGDESDLETALRELSEETGLTVNEIIEDSPITEEYWFTEPNGTKVHKQVTYFLGETHDPLDKQLSLHPVEVLGASWFPYTEALNQLTFKESRQLLQQAEAFLIQSDSKT